MKDLVGQLKNRLNASVMGAENAVSELIAALFGGGHVLIEGAPGIGKTTLVKTLSDSISGNFKRIQFTPDLVPSDLLGYSIYRQDKGKFQFTKGPVFTNFLLADEINRTSPRIQSALLECMNEGQVSIDGKTHSLPDVFHVIATQNNRYTSGTFPLPEPQLDRFIASVEMTLPDNETRTAILQYHANDPVQAVKQPDPVASLEELMGIRKAVRELPIAKDISRYIVRFCDAVRRHQDLDGEISNRGAIALMRIAQANAFMNEHDGVFPEDVKQAILPSLSHRIRPAGDDSIIGDSSIQRQRVSSILRELRDSVPVD